MPRSETAASGTALLLEMKRVAFSGPVDWGVKATVIWQLWPGAMLVPEQASETIVKSVPGFDTPPITRDAPPLLAMTTYAGELALLSAMLPKSREVGLTTPFATGRGVEGTLGRAVAAGRAAACVEANGRAASGAATGPRTAGVDPFEGAGRLVGPGAGPVGRSVGA